MGYSYSNRIVKFSDDLSFTIVLPASERDVSAHVFNEYGFAPYFIVEPGVREIEIDTDNAWVLFRTEVLEGEFRPLQPEIVN